MNRTSLYLRPDRPRSRCRVHLLLRCAQEKAVALAEVAAGDTGGKLLAEIRSADEWLVSDGKAASSDYGRGLYYFAFVGEPKADSAWMLQIAGHHLAYNFSYSSKCTSATPLFDGVEPTSWKDGSVEHQPLETQRAAMVALLAAVSDKSGSKFRMALAAVSGVCASCWLLERTLQLPDPSAPALAWLQAHPLQLLIAVAAFTLSARLLPQPALSSG